MKLVRFRVEMFRCIIDSKWVEVTPLTVLVGKNESGKTTLLKALHKFNPFSPDPYDIRREWPRSRRDERTDEHVVCTAEFELTSTEIEGLRDLTTEEAQFDKANLTPLQVTRNYAGEFEVLFPDDIFPDKLHPNDIDDTLDTLPNLPDGIGEGFHKEADAILSEAQRYAAEGRFSDLENLCQQFGERLRANLSPDNPLQEKENTYISQLEPKLKEVTSSLKRGLSIQDKAHEYVVDLLPTVVYMDEYRSFQGMAFLDQVKQRKERGQLTDEDKTLLTILALSGLDLDDEAKKATEQDREERQYDLSDASATLTRIIEDHWGQLKYEVEFGADGPQFFTWVKDEKDRARIRLEERSRGFQWFFSFDLLLMHETKGTMSGCVILLDEPGLHLHPEGQRDLLKRLEAYAEGNTLLYTSHLPFMIDLQEPDRIRILSEADNGTIVTDDLTQTQPEGKLTLQAALGISGRTSFLVAPENLVVEGVDDYWYLTALSGLLIRCGESGLPEDLFITAAGGASEVTYIATFMVGQELDVVALYDTDNAGNTAKDKLVKKWLARYKDRKAQALSLGPATEVEGREFSIEDLFPDDFYLKYVKAFYQNQLVGVGKPDITLQPGEQLVKRVERFFEDADLKFNKGSIAKRICADIRKMKNMDNLPPETVDKARKLFTAIADAMPDEG
jgi:energy-coupling factor transporter ATP-binding protein EcfA2